MRTTRPEARGPRSKFRCSLRPIPSSVVLSFLLGLLDASAQGLRGEYFANQFLTNTPFVRTDASINFNWANGSPAPGIPNERFSVRWTGELVPQFEEVYTFYTGSDDGIRVWINGVRIINNWQPHILVTNTATMFLKANHRYRIQVDFFDLTVDAIASLSWASARQPRQIIPGTRLFLPVNAENRPPNLPIILTPANGDTVDANNLVMRTDSFSDPDYADAHTGTEWEIWNADFSERIWSASTAGTNLTKVRLSDGLFENSFPGRTSLRLGEQYLLRVHHVDSAGAWSDPAERIFDTDEPITALVMQGSIWRYRDTGVLPSATWHLATFNDNLWASGPAQLGVGDGDENTVTCCATGPRTTTYFRHRFVITNIAQFTNFIVRLLRDDGGIVYINGTEVFRDNMPAGAPVYSTLATASAQEAEESWLFRAGAVPNGVLREGTNVVAVEVHQNSATSSDMSFDLELIATRLPQPLKLNVARTGSDCVTFSWADEDALLEFSPDMNGSWIEVPGQPTSPFTTCEADGKLFYRLKKRSDL